MQRVYDFLKKAETYYLATIDGDHQLVHKRPRRHSVLTAMIKILFVCHGRIYCSE